MSWSLFLWSDDVKQPIDILHPRLPNESDDEFMRRLISEALDDPRPSVPAEKVFARLERQHAERMKKNARRPSR
jgi:hypothetical protein